MLTLILLSLLLVSNPMAMILAGIGLVKNPTYSKKYTIIIVISLAVLAFSYYPAGHSDLVRYYEQLESIRQVSLIQAFDYFDDGLYIKNIFFWIISKLRMPGLIQVASIGIVYGITFYITVDYAEEEGKRRYIWVVLLIQFLCLNYVSIANNVRNVIAFSLIDLAAYRDLKKKKFDLITILLYILPCFIHKAGFVLLLLRIALLFTRKKIIIPAIATLLIPEIIVLSFRFRTTFARFGTLGKIVSDAILTAYRATISTSNWAITVTTSRYHLTDRYSTIFLCICFIIVILIMSQQRKTDLTISFFGLICLLTISCNVFRTPAYWRFFTAALCISGPIIIELLSGKTIKKIDTHIILILLIIFSSYLFVLHIYGSRQDIVIFDMFTDSLCNPLGIVIARIVIALVMY